MNERPLDERSASSRVRASGRGSRGGHDVPIGRLAEFGFHSPYDRHKTVRRAEMFDQKLTAGRLCERELCFRVNCAEMTEVLVACWQL
jgi:hypothetical protein